ncbi:MAG TPA: hypothetical protein VFV35_05820 [Acidimicrobiales bacterium]|nr:hypothetical protein [Acidimicrobiales bacterium]
MTATHNPLDQHPLAARGEHSPMHPVTVRSARQIGNVDWRQAAGMGLIALGAVAIIIAWYGVSGTLDPAEQMPYISSGGFGGAALIAVGVTLLSSFEHARDRAALEELLERLDSVESELSELRSASTAPAPPANGVTRASRSRRSTQS